MTTTEADVQLPLKKRARRRLVGAVALAVFAAVVLPMVMDQAPQAPVADVRITIPGQDQVPPLAAKAAPPSKPAEAQKPAEVAAKPAVPVAPAPKPEAGTSVAPTAVAKLAEPVVARPAEKSAEKPAEKRAEKPAEKPADKPMPKPAEKPVAKPADDDARRAAAILAGKPADAAPAVGNTQFVILIGAFANPANVKQLQAKLGEIGIKTFTEPLDSPQGKKTRVRAGPFPSAEAAEKAQEKMKRIGVNGIVAAKQ